jgi:hypothetical protein
VAVYQAVARLLGLPPRAGHSLPDLQSCLGATKPYAA